MYSAKDEWEFENYYEWETGGSRPRVVFIPGIMGSVLRDPTVNVGAMRREAIRAIPAGLPLLVRLALELAINRADMRVIWGTVDMLPWLLIPTLWRVRLLQGNGLNRPGAVVATEMLSLPGVDPYSLFVDHLRANSDLLVFPYDWRLSNDVTAMALETAILGRWWGGVDPQDVAHEERVTIIAHSMGGLIARNFIEGRKGFGFVRRLITGGTPHDGAPEAYTNYHGATLPFGFVLPGLRIPVGIGIPAALQIELTQSYASTIQLMPDSTPFVNAGGSIEPLATTYSAMPHLPTGTNVVPIMRLLRNGFQPRPPVTALADFLASGGVRYNTLAGSNLSTVTSFNATAGSGPGAVPRRGAAISSNAGDGTVPIGSALLPADGVNILNATFPRVEHQGLYKDLAVRNHCLGLIGLPAMRRELEIEMEGTILEQVFRETEISQFQAGEYGTLLNYR